MDTGLQDISGAAQYCSALSDTAQAKVISEGEIAFNRKAIESSTGHRYN